MKIFYLLTVIPFLSACASGPIFGDDEAQAPTKTVAVTETVDQPQTASQKQPEKAVEQPARPDYVPYVTGPYKEASSQQIYTVLASRTANEMLIDTASLYTKPQAPTVYINTPITEGALPIPENSLYSTQVVKDIINGTHSYKIVDSPRRADYVLDTYISRKPIANRETTIVVYKLVLSDKNNKNVGSWTETLSPIINDDQSWW